MTEELAVREPSIEAVVDGRTGEVLALRDAPLGDLARWLEDIRIQEAAVREQKAAVSMELHRRMDEQVNWSLHTDGYKITGAPPSRVTYDAEQLHTELQHLVDDGLLPPAAMADAVERSFSYSVKTAGVNRLRKAGGAVAGAIEKCTRPVDPAKRRISLSRIR